MKSTCSTPSPNGSSRAGTAGLLSSAHHRWSGALALDIAEGPGGEWRHEHRRLALQVWHQPLSVRPLLGAGGWRTIEAGARLWLPGERQHYEWRQTPRTTVVLVTHQRVEQVLGRPFAQVSFERWRGIDFQSPFISTLVAAMAEDLASDCPAGPIVGESLTAALIAYLEAGPVRVIDAESRPSPSPRRLERVLLYIRDNLAEPLRMAELAREAGCSPKQLSRAFVERTGRLPHRYVLEQRIKRAMELIEAGEDGLAQVAVSVGFADQSQMTKTFRKLTGTTPGQVKKRAQAPASSLAPTRRAAE